MKLTRVISALLTVLTVTCSPVFADSNSIINGDANKDGTVNLNDCNLILRYIAGWEMPDGIDTGAADANNDGNVNLGDATILLKRLAGWKWIPHAPTVEEEAWWSECSECQSAGLPVPTFAEWLESNGFDSELYLEWFESDYKNIFSYEKWLEKK